jgi:monothiol glutaredoxin
MSDGTQEKIATLVKTNPVVLFMKGTADFPQCGFSARSISIVRALGVEFLDFDVLADPEIRAGIKQYANWPTIPQLYINGEFVGGSDIMMEMFEAGDLQKIISEG